MEREKYCHQRDLIKSQYKKTGGWRIQSKPTTDSSLNPLNCIKEYFAHQRITFVSQYPGCCSFFIANFSHTPSN